MSKERTPRQVSRREFVKGAAGVAGVAAVGAVASCVPLPAATPAPTPAPQKWDRETDVVVVGSGMAALCAAVEAADAGAQVLVLEKGFYPGGNSLLCGGNTVLGATHVQARMKIEDHAEWWYEDQMAYGEHRAVPELMSVYTAKGGEFALWFEQLGLVWADVIGKQEDGRVPRGHRAAPSPNYAGGSPGYAGISQITVLVRAAEKRNVPILLNHKMTRILRPDLNGPVVGVEVDTPAGTINIKARKAVVLGSGGWKSNVQMRMAWDHRLDTNLGAGGLPYVNTTGDGIMAAVDIGAGITDMSYVCELRIKWGTHTYQLWEPPVLTTTPVGSGLGMGDYQRPIAVKNDGQRYVDETTAVIYPQHRFYDAFLNLREKSKNVWAVTDAEGAAALKWSLAQFQNPQPKVLPCLYPDYVAVADSLQLLASKMGIPPASLEATVSRYNGFVDAGKDADFGKPMPLYKISKPPFFGAKLFMLAHDQMGGLRANTRAQVLERSDQVVAQGISIDEEKVIPHLYAAGECVGGYVGVERGHGKVGVYGIWGRIAGQNAARETRLS